MDTLITVLVIIYIIYSIFKNVVKKIPVESKSESESDYDYEDDEYEYDEDDEDYDEYEEEVPQSMKELWDKFQTPQKSTETVPPPIPKKEVIVHEPIEYKPIDHKPIEHETLSDKKIIHEVIEHKKTSSDFQKPFAHKSVESLDESKAYDLKVRKRSGLLKGSALRKAIVWSEILAKPVSFRDK